MMHRTLPLLLILAPCLPGCDQLDLSGGGATTDTNMRSVEIEMGTASDEMIILDQASGDGTAIDTSVATGPTAPRPTGDAADDGDAPRSNEDGDAATGVGDQVIRPPAGGAEPDAPPEPAKN